MIRLENLEVYNLGRAIYSARNPMNSWGKSDSDIENDVLGENDLNLANKLFKAGSDHSKFMRQIFVTVDITAPFYWWKEADTYKVGTVANSCSTMHKLMARPLELNDFSYDVDDLDFQEYLKNTIAYINGRMEEYRKAENIRQKWIVWRSIIMILPCCYNQRRTLTLNYAVLANMLKARENHKLSEWREFCRFMYLKCPYLERIMLSEWRK